MEWTDTGEGKKLTLRLAGTAVSSLVVVTQQIRVRGAKLQLGGIGDVHTVRRHRRRGYASQAMRTAVAWMGEQGYDLSILFGISDFYDRFGYESVFARSALYVKSADLLRARSTCTVRALRRGDAAAVLRLYHSLNRHRSGTTIRSPDWRPPSPCLVAADSRDRIAGYATLRSQEVVVLELGARTDDALRSLAAAIRRRAHRRKQEEVRLWLPEDHAFGKLAADLGCRWAITCPRNEGAMARIISLSQLIRKLTGVLGRRAGQLRHLRPGRLSLMTDIGSLGLDVSPDGVEICPPTRGTRVVLPQGVLAQVALGYRAPEEVITRDGVKMPKRALPLLDDLFPKGCPYMWMADRY